MFRRNPGRFTETIKLMRPSAPKRDALGGVSAITYTDFLKLRALVTVKSQSKQQIIGDYVTVDTRYVRTWTAPGAWNGAARRIKSTTFC